MERKCYISAVDLGSSNVVVAVAERFDDGSLALRGLVSKPLKVGDVVAGQIENIQQVGEAVIAAFEEAGEQANIRITEAYAGVSGEFVRCARHSDYVFVSKPETGVSDQDVKNLFDRMRNLQAPEKEVIMEYIPQHYLIDNKKEVQHPNGSFGNKLSSTFNYVLCAKTPMERIGLAFRRAGVELAEVLPNTLALPEVVLNEDEKEEGVAVVDIGGEVTDVTVYFRKVVRYVASIPMGANAINKDIRALGVPERYVESLKQKYGSAVAARVGEEKVVRVTGRTQRETLDILQRNLATAIESRMLDIIEYVMEELEISGYADRLNYGIVLTGGSANLTDVEDLFRQVTKMEVRVAVPESGLTPESLDQLADPAYATIAGLLVNASARSHKGTAYVALPPKPVVVPEQPVQPEQPIQPEPPKAQPESEKPAISVQEQGATPEPPQQSGSTSVEQPSVTNDEEDELENDPPVVPDEEEIDEEESPRERALRLKQEEKERRAREKQEEKERRAREKQEEKERRAREKQEQKSDSPGFFGGILGKVEELFRKAEDEEL
ncbi:MAG: cell division protein FtsA [Alistipes sp.]|nr:cell division protein FtsA [Alistipes sp.]